MQRDGRHLVAVVVEAGAGDHYLDGVAFKLRDAVPKRAHHDAQVGGVRAGQSRKRRIWALETRVLRIAKVVEGVFVDVRKLCAG